MRSGITLKSAAEIARMAAAGQVVAGALEAARRAASVGVTLAELDAVAEAVIRSRGAVPLFKHYHPRWSPTPFPGTLCTSVNDVVVHGIPDGRVLEDGDLVSIDCGARLGEWCGDAAVSFVVGRARADDLRLVEATERALAAGIAAARPGASTADVAAAVWGVAATLGYGLLADHGGHGIGRQMHEPPSVANQPPAGAATALHVGMVIAIEPMLLADGTRDYVIDDDFWTVRTATGARAAHAEHTVAVTAGGPRVLTVS